AEIGPHRLGQHDQLGVARLPPARLDLQDPSLAAPDQLGQHGLTQPPRHAVPPDPLPHARPLPSIHAAPSSCTDPGRVQCPTVPESTPGRVRTDTSPTGTPSMLRVGFSAKLKSGFPLWGTTVESAGTNAGGTRCRQGADFAGRREPHLPAAP